MNSFGGGIYTFLNSNTSTSGPSNAGTVLSRTELYASDTQDTFGDANGLGGLAAITSSGAIQVGDRVFTDQNGNGIQDPGEAGIAGVVVSLFQGSTKVASVTTDADGGYLFDALQPNTAYQIRIDTLQTPLADRSLAQAKKGINSELDSDATLSGTTATVAFTTAGTGTTDMSRDIGFSSAVSVPAHNLTIGNLVFRDTNNDGLFDSSDAGIAGVVLELLDATGAATGQTATTDANGNYKFGSLAEGAYKVRIAASNFNAGGALAGYTSSTFNGADLNNNVNNDDNGSISGTLGSGGVIVSGSINLSAGSEPTSDGDSDPNTNLTLDFGVVPPVAVASLTIGNLVFQDTNNNGTFDAADVGIDGVSVELLDQSGTPVVGKTTTTSGGGLYSFSGLSAGTYKVRLSASNFNSVNTSARLVGFTPSTTSSATADNNVNNDNNGTASGTLGSGGFVVSGPITLAANGEPTNDGDSNANTNLTLDFGLTPPPPPQTVSLGSTVFIDANDNGLFDSGESPMAGVVVQLVDVQGNVLKTDTTKAQGNYSFTGLNSGDYRVRIASSNFTGSGVLVGFTSSTGTNGSATGTFEPAVDPDNNIDNNDDGQISGTLGQANGVIESGVITLGVGAEPVNDGDSSANTNLSVDFGVFRKFSVGNLVFNDLNNNGIQDAGENGMANVSVQLLDVNHGNSLVATTTTNTDGQYLFSNLVSGSYVVQLAATNFNAGGSLLGFRSSTGNGNAFEPAPTGTTDKRDHGTTNGTLGSGGTIRSSAIAVGPNATMPTGESANNDSATPDNQCDLTVDFGLYQPAPTNASIAGRVFLDFNNSGTFNGVDRGIPGVTITLTGGNLAAPLPVQTDASGNFTFNNLASGTYTLTETQPASPANQTGKNTAGSSGGNAIISNVVSSIPLADGAAATGYLFAEVPLVSTGGSVFEDANGNGVKDNGEAGIPGVTVTLSGTGVVIGTIAPQPTTTDANGNFTFNNLTPGTYSLAETQPANFLDGKEQNGIPAAATPASDQFTGIDLTSMATSSGGFNFGEVRGTSVSGAVFDDVNDDGSQAAGGEPGIAGVTVVLTGSNDLGQAINQSTATSADGTFSFAGLRPGTYKLAETQPTNFTEGTSTAGSAGGDPVATIDEISGIALTSGATATGYLFGEHANVDLAVSQTPGSATVAPGGKVTITYTVRNKGNGTVAGVSGLVNFAGLQFVSSNSTDFDKSTGVWTIGNLAAGEKETIKITYRAGHAGTFRPSFKTSVSSMGTSTEDNSTSSRIVAKVSPPSIFGLFWFLSSGTNAHRSSGWW